MTLKEQFRNPPNRVMRDRIISEIGSSQENFDELVSLMIFEDDPVSWRAAWVADYCDEACPGLATRHLPALIRQLPKKSDGFRRSCLRMISRHKVGPKEQGRLADLCFNWMVTETVPVAIKVHCMQILANLTQQYPELTGELVMVIEDQLDLNSAGFKSRGKMILKYLTNSRQDIS
ncbi:MAG: hypothetical protein ACOYXB_06065 [Bacteroidota bacterium]